MAKQQPSLPPPEALPAGEPNRFVAKFKASLCKRWSVTKMETLYEISSLAAYFWALERQAEALAIARSIATAVPAPPPLPRGRVNYNVWCPATYLHAMVVHLGASAAPDEASASRAALLADAGIARDNPDFLTKQVAEARQREAATPNPEDLKWECQGLARAVGWMNLYAELAAAGDELFAPHGPDAAAAVPRLLAKLGALLRTA